MKKLIILILLFVVTCNKVTDKTVINNEHKKPIKGSIYNSKEKNNKSSKKEDVINDKKQTKNTDKKLSTTIVDNSNKENIANIKPPIIKREEKYPLKLKKKSRK